MSEAKRIKPGRKVKFVRRNGKEATGKLLAYWVGGRGEWATVNVDGKAANVRPSQLQLA